MEQNEQQKGLQKIDFVNMNVKQLSNVIKSSLLEGEGNAAKLGVVLKRMEKLHKEVTSDESCKEAILEETRKYMENGKSAEILGAVISERATKTWYDFNECGHTEYDDLCRIEEFVKNRKKEIEAELKLLIPDTKKSINSFAIKKSSKSIIIENTYKLEEVPLGDVVDVKPPQKLQSSGLVYTKV